MWIKLYAEEMQFIMRARVIPMKAGRPPTLVSWNERYFLLVPEPIGLSKEPVYVETFVAAVMELG